MSIDQIVDTDTHRLTDAQWCLANRRELRANGAVQLRGFLRAEALARLQEQAEAVFEHAYFKPQTHSIYLGPPDDAFAADHIRNYQVLSSKGCVTDDQIDTSSPLKQLYNNSDFKTALCSILEEDALYPYADSLSSVNIHYARRGEELGWHFDNSSFAVTLMIQPAGQGGIFEYVKDVRDADNGDMGYGLSERIVKGRHPVSAMNIAGGDLLLFRGRNSLHRVTPVGDDSTRQLAVLAYNNAPGISLSENARMTFYGRIGSVQTQSHQP